MKRSALIATIAVQLAKTVSDTERIPSAVEEFLSEHRWAGDVYDRNEWDWRRFVRDVAKVWEQHR